MMSVMFAVVTIALVLIVLAYQMEITRLVQIVLACQMVMLF
jgi:hypothetical protein